MAASEAAQFIKKLYSWVRKELVEVGRLYPDGFLLLKDVDRQLWIENNNNPADHHSVRCLELRRPINCDSLGILSQLTRLCICDGYFKCLPSSISNLPNLQHLELHFCPQLQELPSVPNLKRLQLQCCLKLQELPSLPNLQRVELYCCPQLQELPSLPNLQRLQLHSCHELQQLPSLPNLQRLELYSCDELQQLPPNLGDLQSLTFFSLCGCVRMESLPNSMVHLSTLKTLHLQRCDSLTDLPAISNVVELILSHCESIKCLPQGLCSNLERLHLEYCESLTELPVDLNVRHLEIECCEIIQPLPAAMCNHFSLSACCQQILLDNLTCFQNLTHLTLHNCDCLDYGFEEMPAKLGGLSELSLLNIQQTKIKWLPWSIITTKLSKLRLLLLPTDFRLETLPEHLNDSLVISVPDTHVRKTWKQLKTEINTFSMPIIQVEEDQFPPTPGYLQCTGDPGPWIQKSNGLHSLVKFLDLDLKRKKLDSDTMDCVAELPQLTHLHMSYASLCALPLTIGRITHLSFSSCRFEDDIILCFDSLVHLSTLQSLKLLHCQKLPTKINLPVSLTHLALEPYFYKPLPDSYMAHMTKLFNLNTLELSRFQDLNLSLLNFNLANLKIRNCSIKSLPTRLQHLEIIHSYGRQQCEKVDCCNQLYVCLNQLINLQTLSVSCYNIEVLPTIARHRKLQQLHLKDCFNLKRLPSDLDHLVELCTLDVSGTRIKYLPGSITNLQKLQHLTVPKCFVHKSLPNNFEEKVRVSTDITDETYYEHAGYYDSGYNSREDNEIMSRSVEGGDQVVSEEFSHNIMTEQASLSRPFNTLLDATQLHEDSHFNCRTEPVNNVVFSSQNLEMQNLPAGNEDWVVPFPPDNISHFNVTDGHHFANEIRQVHDEIEDFLVDGRINAVGESSSRAPCSLRHHEMELLDATNSNCVGTVPDDMAAKSSSKILETNCFGENNQQGTRLGQMDSINLEDEQRDPPCDSLKDKIPQSVVVKLKKTQKIEISRECILQYMSGNMTLEGAAMELGISRSTMKRRLKECGITWSTNPKKKQHQDAKNKEHNSMSSSQRNSSQPSLVVSATSAGHDTTAEHIDGSCSTFDVKTTYKGDIVRIYKLSSSLSIDQLKEKVGEKLGLEVGKFKMKYLDEEDDWVLMSCSSDLEHALRLSKSSGISVVKLSVIPEI